MTKKSRSGIKSTLQEAMFLACLILLAGSSSNLPAAAEKPADIEAGEAIYMKKCEVCHLIGRNLLNPEKEIQNSKLLDDPKKLKEFLSRKNGTMPAFLKLANDDERLKELNKFLHYARKNPSEVLKETQQSIKESSKEQSAEKQSEDKAKKDKQKNKQ